MMIRLLAVQVLILLVCGQGGVLAGTMGEKMIPCTYKNLKKPSLNIYGICQVQHGVIGHTGKGYRRVVWPDGVITLIQISSNHSSQRNTSAVIDQYFADAWLKCGQEIYAIHGNTIKLTGNLCQ
jgi:hypothetical protein